MQVGIELAQAVKRAGASTLYTAALTMYSTVFAHHKPYAKIILPRRSTNYGQSQAALASVRFNPAGHASIVRTVGLLPARQTTLLKPCSGSRKRELRYRD